MSCSRLSCSFLLLFSCNRLLLTRGQGSEDLGGTSVILDNLGFPSSVNDSGTSFCSNISSSELLEDQGLFPTDGSGASFTFPLTTLTPDVDYSGDGPLNISVLGPPYSSEVSEPFLRSNISSTLNSTSNSALNSTNIRTEELDTGTVEKGWVGRLRDFFVGEFPPFFIIFDFQSDFLPFLSSIRQHCWPSFGCRCDLPTGRWGVGWTVSALSGSGTYGKEGGCSGRVGWRRFGASF